RASLTLCRRGRPRARRAAHRVRRWRLLHGSPCADSCTDGCELRVTSPARCGATSSYGPSPWARCSLPPRLPSSGRSVPYEVLVRTASGSALRDGDRVLGAALHHLHRGIGRAEERLGVARVVGTGG